MHLVHCGTPPVTMHIMQGMYLAVVVDPEDGWGSDADREFVLVQSEFYGQPGTDGAPMQPDPGAAMGKSATYVTFNGRAYQYKEGASGEGYYAFVTHAFADAEKGAVGLIQVGEPSLDGAVGH